MNKQILITGVAGMIGSHLAEELLTKDYATTGIDVQVLPLSSFYRVYSISLLQRVKAKHLALINETGFICMLEILVKSLKAEAKVIEVPMKLHSSKRQGLSKMKVFKTTLQYFIFLFKKHD